MTNLPYSFRLQMARVEPRETVENLRKFENTPGVSHRVPWKQGAIGLCSRGSSDSLSPHRVEYYRTLCPGGCENRGVRPHEIAR